MAFNGYLHIPDIKGEARTNGHEDEIDVHGISWGFMRESSTSVGRGRTQSRAKAENLVVQKFTDAASPYLALAGLQGKSFDELVLSVRKEFGAAPLDYLVITMTNCVITAFDMNTDDNSDQITEHLSLSFEKTMVTYTVQANDHSSGDEHEIAFDLVAGA